MIALERTDGICPVDERYCGITIADGTGRGACEGRTCKRHPAYTPPAQACPECEQHPAGCLECRDKATRDATEHLVASAKGIAETLADLAAQAGAALQLMADTARAEHAALGSALAGHAELQRVIRQIHGYSRSIIRTTEAGTPARACAERIEELSSKCLAPAKETADA